MDPPAETAATERHGRRPPAWLVLLLGILAGFGALTATAILVLTETDWGRERVRTAAIGKLTEQIAGRIRIGKLQGHLLLGATLIDVSIEDSTGGPFLRADTIRLHYSLRSFLTKRLDFDDVRVARPRLVLDQPPGQSWNFQRIFPRDTTAADTVPGFGSWVRLHDLTIRNGTIVVRQAWAPPDSLKGAARRRYIAQATSPSSRPWIVRVPGGWQRISSFGDVNARIPYVRFADPDSTARVVDVDSLRMTAFVYRPPPAVVRQLSGRFVVDDDSVYFRDAVVALPNSRLAVSGAYALDASGLWTRLRTTPTAAFPDLRFAYPQAPPGGGRFALFVNRHQDGTHVIARDVDVRAEGAHVTGYADVRLGPKPRVGASDVAFTGVDTRLIRRYTNARPPVNGTLAGHLRLAGTPAALDVDGWASFREVGGATSRIDADGRVLNGPAGLAARDLRLRFQPLRLALLEAFGLDLPVGGQLRGRATLNGRLHGPLDLKADLTHAGGGTGVSHVIADGRIITDGGVLARDLTLHLDPLQAALVRRFDPSAPLRGTLTGRATLNGDPNGRLAVDANLVNRDPQAGRSHVRADGLLLLGGPATGMRNLRLRLEPLQLALVRRVAPSLPVDGTLAGCATLNGSTAGRIAATFDLAHDAATGPSRFVGRAVVNARAPTSFFNIDLRAPTDVALATVGRFLPAAGLRGRAAGSFSAHGPMSDLSVALDLATSGGGRIAGAGTLDLAAATTRYDVALRLNAFDAAAVTTRGPSTRLTGTLAVQGQGTDPATMTALVRADLVDLRLGGQTFDTTHVLARIDDGLAVVQRGQIRLASARADLTGSFGLVAGRSGTLLFDVEVDSLSRFDGLAPADTTRVRPRPLLHARALARARADSARAARRTEVERMATGRPGAPRLRLVAPPALRRDSIAGRLTARGQISGNVKLFDARGTAMADHVAFDGTTLGRGRATFTISGFGSPLAGLSLDARVDSLRVGGFAFDSGSARVRYTGVRDRGRGTARLALFQDSLRDYRLASAFQLALDRREVRLDTLVLRFDTTRWAATHPGTVRWSRPGLQFEAIDLASNTGGHVSLEGRLPTDAPADLRLDVERLPIGDIVAMLQDTTQVAGLLSLHARMRGTRRTPIIAGDFTLAHARYGAQRLLNLRSTFAYANTELNAHAVATGDPIPVELFDADARLPINLALAGYSGPRLLDRPLSVLARVDSLPLEALPNPVTETVTDVHGRVRGNIQLHGTYDAPRLAGELVLDRGSMRLVYPNVLLEDVHGRLRLRGDSAFVDSLVARSGGGTLATGGSLVLASLARPTFNLTVDLRRALILDNDQGRIRANADLTVKGPFDRVAIGGSATILDGVIYAPDPTTKRRVTNLDDPIFAQAIDTSRVPPGVLPRPNPLLENLTVDVALRVERNTWVRNTDGNVEIYTPQREGPLHVRLDRRARTLTLEGVINADHGEYTFAGRTFQLTTGSMTFVGGPTLNPLLQLTAQYDVRRQGQEALIIQIHVLGDLQHPRVTLESNAQPPLSQSDLISYLAFGRTAGSLIDVSGSSIATGPGRTLGGLTAVAQQQLGPLALGAWVDQAVSEVERQGSRAGLDVFRLHPGGIPDEFAFQNYFANLVRGTQYEAGKYLSRRLFVSLGGDFYTSPGVAIEYRTPGGFSWRTTWLPVYLPGQPTLSVNDRNSTQARSFGTFFFWNRRF
ncbi:MAG: translocation/assembly module TamB [Gemmatimonadetes bacterium]|nr:translocation/assembly module TamB [Gemmatimonadota bacterium]